MHLTLLHKNFVSLLAIVIYSVKVYGADDLIVELPQGKIQGHTLTSYNGNEYYGFQEIPYAAPPTGRNRFQLPKSPEPWDGIRDATNNKVMCIQDDMMPLNLTSDEDCLVLNVYTPVKPGTTDSLLPVLFWIHGGGFASGSGAINSFKPTFAMDYNIVIVTINYRLGILGFLSSEDDVIPGNLGLKDQRFALEWVYDYIALFNGDRNQVTIDGQSAGSASVGLHVIGPWNSERQTFQAAIQQSGTPLWPTYQTDARQNAFEAGRSLNSSLVSDNSEELLLTLQAASAEDLLAVHVSGGSFLFWVPILEKEGDFSYNYLEAFTSGQFKRIPLLIGFNSEEMIGMGYNEDQAPQWDKDPSIMLSTLLNMSPENRTVVGQLLKNVYTNTSFEENKGAFVRYNSDNNFTTPTTKQAELASKYTNIFLYQFAYKGELGHAMNIPFYSGAEKVGHGEDVQYFWESIETDINQISDVDMLTVQRLVTLWTNFVKYRNPTPEQDNLFDNQFWPQVNSTNNDEIPYFNINETVTIQTNPRYYQKVKRIFDEYILPPYIIY